MLRPLNRYVADAPAFEAWRAEPPLYEVEVAVAHVPEYVSATLVCWLSRGVRVGPATQGPMFPALSVARIRYRTVPAAAAARSKAAEGTVDESVVQVAPPS